MSHSAIDKLTSCIEQNITPHSFKRMSPTPVISAGELVAAWKRKSFNSNRGIALVMLPDSTAHPGAFARSIKKAVGKRIGYLPFLYELGLQLVVVGRGVFEEAAGLQGFVDEINTQTVLLQSIHVIDTELTDRVDAVLTREGTFEKDTDVPKWARGLELLSSVKRFSPDPTFERGKIRCLLSETRKRACLSVRTWGQTTTGPLIDAIEDGINQFIQSE